MKSNKTDQARNNTKPTTSSTKHGQYSNTKQKPNAAKYMAEKSLGPHQSHKLYSKCYFEKEYWRETQRAHEVCWGNKWMGSSDFGAFNKTTSQTAGWGLKTKDDNKIKQQTDMKEQVNTSSVQVSWEIVWEQMLWAKMMINLKLKLGPRSDWLIQILVNW